MILAISLSYFLSMLYIRRFLYGVKRYQLNLSACKKRKKGETFKEWLLYSRFKEEIPKILLVLYYIVLIIHPVGVIACAFSRVLSLNIDRALAKFIAIFDLVWILLLMLLFWTPSGDDAYERWITKKRGQKKKREIRFWKHPR